MELDYEKLLSVFNYEFEDQEIITNLIKNIERRGRYLVSTYLDITIVLDFEYTVLDIIINDSMIEQIEEEGCYDDD